MSIRELARDVALAKVMHDVAQIKEKLDPPEYDSRPRMGDTFAGKCLAWGIGIIAAPFLLVGLAALMVGGLWLLEIVMTAVGVA